MKRLFFSLALMFVACEPVVDTCEQELVSVPAFGSGGIPVNIAIDCCSISAIVPGLEPHTQDHSYILIDGIEGSIVVRLNISEVYTKCRLSL